MAQSNGYTPRKNPTKRVVKEDNKVSDTEGKNLYHFTDRILKTAYDINIVTHHSKHANSIKRRTSKFNHIGIDTIHIKKILEEMANF